MRSPGSPPAGPSWRHAGTTAPGHELARDRWECDSQRVEALSYDKSGSARLTPRSDPDKSGARRRPTARVGVVLATLAAALGWQAVRAPEAAAAAPVVVRLGDTLLDPS